MDQNSSPCGTIHEERIAVLVHGTAASASLHIACVVAELIRLRAGFTPESRAKYATLPMGHNLLIQMTCSSPEQAVMTRLTGKWSGKIHRATIVAHSPKICISEIVRGCMLRGDMAHMKSICGADNCRPTIQWHTWVQPSVLHFDQYSHT